MYDLKICLARKAEMLKTKLQLQIGKQKLVLTIAGLILGILLKGSAVNECILLFYLLLGLPQCY